MELTQFRFSRLHNEEHFQFHTEFSRQVDIATPAALGIVALYSIYMPLYDREFEALGFIRRSDITDDLADADYLRDFTYRGLTDMVKACGNHFNLQIREAATRVQVVFDYYGNLTVKSYDDETAAITKLISQLGSEYASDVVTLGIADWLTELQSNNANFDEMLQGRNTREAAKTQLRMREVRLELDAAYRTIAERINALIIVNGETNYKLFVDEMNQWIERYNNTVAIRLGHLAKDDSTEETKG